MSGGTCPARHKICHKKTNHPILQYEIVWYGKFMSLDRFRPQKRSPDYAYVGLAVVLVLIGLIMISSSSVVIAVETYNQTYGFVLRQLVALAIGTVGAVIASRIPHDQWRRLTMPFFAFSLILVIFMLVSGLGKETKGAVRWINLGWFQLQPSELLKLSSILYVSAWLEKRTSIIKQFETLIAFCLILAPIIILMLLQRDLGTLLVILITLGVLFVMAGASTSQIVVGLVSGFALVLLLIVIEPYRLTRLTTFRNAGADTLGAGYHINQANLAIGSGGWWGRGFGQSLQKYLYLPEPQTDSIFAITVEELGFVRSTLILVLIGAFAYRGFQIAHRAGETFARLLAFGLTSMLLLQAVINIAAIMGLVPLTGVPLPFISYGGTSLVSSLLAVGIMVSISRNRYAAN